MISKVLRWGFWLYFDFFGDFGCTETIARAFCKIIDARQVF